MQKETTIIVIPLLNFVETIKGVIADSEKTVVLCMEIKTKLCIATKGMLELSLATRDHLLAPIRSILDLITAHLLAQFIMVIVGLTRPAQQAMLITPRAQQAMCLVQFLRQVMGLHRAWSIWSTNCLFWPDLFGTATA